MFTLYNTNNEYLKKYAFKKKFYAIDNNFMSLVKKFLSNPQSEILLKI